MAFLKTESYKKGILYSSAFNVGSKTIAFFQQWLIGFYFGSHSETDVFFFTYSIVLYISYFFLNLTTSVLIPEGIKLRNQEGEKSSMTFLNTFILLYGLAGIAIIGICCSDTSAIFGKISSFSEDVISSNIDLIIWCMPLIYLTIMVNLISEIMASYKFFTVPNMINAINSILGVLFVVLFHNSLGLPSVAIGLIIGSLINIVIIVSMMKKELNWNFSKFCLSRTKAIFTSGLYAQGGFIVYLIALFVPQYFFSQFSEGSLTAMNYADKIVSIPGIFLVTQITNVMAIKYNNLVSNNRLDEVSNVTTKLMTYISGGLFAVAILILIGSNFIVDILFGWGKFTPESLKLTSELLSLMILYLPFGFAYNMFMRIFNSFKKQNYVLWIQALTQGVILILYYLFIPKYGELSFPILRLIPYVLSIFIIIPLFKALCPSIKAGRMITIFAALTVLTAAIIFMAI